MGSIKKELKTLEKLEIVYYCVKMLFKKDEATGRIKKEVNKYPKYKNIALTTFYDKQ